MPSANPDSCERTMLVIRIIEALRLLNAERLKELVEKSLQEQGFEICDGQFSLPDEPDKHHIRSLHAEATRYKIHQRKNGLVRYEGLLLQRLASGADVIPEDIEPELVEVHPRTQDELLFRYASLHWSIPVSSGYGRRLRFLVVDRSTGKLIGLFGLGDPVFSLKDRDVWVGWNQEDRRERLHHVVDAYVLGAVPPYSYLLCGKLIAMLAVSNEVRDAFKRKYKGRSSLIQSRKLPGQLAMVTTTSALGRSSLYNRIRFDERLVFERVGHTKGFGEFHFSNGIYSSLAAFARGNSTATAKHESWGNGFRNRREVVQKTLAQLGLSHNLRNHGVEREIYVSALAENTADFLKGEDSELDYYDQPADDMFEWFKNRWLLPRSERDQRYKEWDPREWTLWPEGNGVSKEVSYE